MNEATGTAVAGGLRSPPGASEGTSAARVLSNELDSARFDPVLIKSIANAFNKAVDIFVDRIDLIVRVSLVPLSYEHWKLTELLDFSRLFGDIVNRSDEHPISGH
jgi:hypothetical protein